MIIQLRKLGAVLIVAVLTAAGCGGSSGGGGSVSPPPPPPPPSGGIVRTGVAVGAGPITGFGSVIVNGITYDTSSATFTRDDNPSSQDQFKVGETVIVKGTIDDDNTNAVAETVELDELIKGPVSAVAGNQLTVMGQTVLADGGTSVDDSCNASVADLSPLASVFAIEVYGTADGAGVITATRIECKVEADFVDDEFEVNGIVSMHDAGAMTFMINDLQVNYGSAMSIDDFPAGQINDGDPVEAEGPPANYDDTGATPVLGATKVEYKGNQLDGNEGDHFEVDGFISDFVSETQFNLRVGTLVIPVTTIPGTTVYEGGSAADLANNLKIEAEGELDADGVLNATKIEIKTSTNIRVTGQVDGVSGDVITILGISVNTDVSKTRFEDKRDDIEPFRVGDVMVDDYVEARGQEQPVGQITAFLIERDDLDADTELRGFVEEGSVVNRDEFVILGVTVDTSNVQPDDYFGDDNLPITADDFWTAVGTGGVIVDVTGTETGDTALQARELQLEME
jgi:hypothetical protein